MAFNRLLHLSPSPILRPSRALFLIITMFAVPFLALSSELILGTLLTLALSLWETLFGLVTGPPFYYFLLNLLIVTLVLTSGFFNPSRPKEEKDAEQEGDLHARDDHHYITAAEMIHERLSLDELYGTQASFLPYSAFQLSPMEGNDAPAFCALEEKAFSSSESISMDMVKRSGVTDGIVGDGSEGKKPPLICSADMNHAPHDDEYLLGNQFQAEKGKIVDGGDHHHHDPDANGEDVDDARVDDDENHDHDHNDTGTDHVNDDDYNDHVVNDDDDDNDHVAHDDDKHRFMRIHDSIPSTHHYDMGVDNLCIETSNAEGLSDDCKSPHNSSLELSNDNSRGIELSHNDDVGAMQRLGNGDSCHVDDARREKEEILMSAEELNERASAFITAFRRKLLLSSGDDHMG